MSRRARTNEEASAPKDSAGGNKQETGDWQRQKMPLPRCMVEEEGKRKMQIVAHRSAGTRQRDDACIDDACTRCWLPITTTPAAL